MYAGIHFLFRLMSFIGYFIFLLFLFIYIIFNSLFMRVKAPKLGPHCGHYVCDVAQTTTAGHILMHEPFTNVAAGISLMGFDTLVVSFDHLADRPSAEYF